MPTIFLNGKLLSTDKATVSIFDRGFLYGDGVFESLRTYHGRPFLLAEHLKRLLAGARFLKIKGCGPLAKLRRSVLKTLAANNFPEAYIKIIITRGISQGHGLDFANVAGPPTIAIIVERLSETTNQPVWQALVSKQRKPSTPSARLKTLCYLDNALAKEEASQAGANEAFLLDEKGFLTEGTISNIFVVKDSRLLTPPLSEPILGGITRQLVIKLARRSGLKVIEKRLKPKELYRCDECFITLSGSGIIPITEVDRKKIGSGRIGLITDKLIKLYRVETDSLASG